jgi:valyl-tRNA synthetase
MDKVYSPAEIEQRLYRQWEAAGYFAPGPGGRAYAIMIPPPNVTGTLHMGHAFQDTIMDALTRMHRMQGAATLWQPGTDHAGIATQMVVERMLNAEGKRRTDLTREAFVERVWAWKEQSGGTISRQMRRLGASVDWSRERFTLDPELSQAVTEAFVRLHEQGLIYRGERLVNWDPVLRTALSDLEVLSEEEEGKLWYLRYPLSDSGAGSGSAWVIVATTRPETMLGDSAVAVNPSDERYRHLIGRQLRLPLAGREIPIIADSFVDPAFGTGCVKITPAHDFNDYAVGQRHGLPLINIFTPDAHMNELVPERFRGLDRFEARERIVEELEREGLIEKIEPHKLMTPRGDRTGAVIEPYLTLQWYVSVAPLAAEATAAVESGRVKFVPANWDKTFYQWMRNIQDWCISRQLWWGHRIPAWYDEQGNIFVARSAAVAHEAARARHGHEVTLRQDQDVLDTWFSSGLWPFSTLGWPAQTPELARFYPTNVLVTGFDIIFFWVARMIMLGLRFMGDVPFREVYIHGLVRDAEGQKMSKSKGNVIDPLDIIDGIELPALLAKRTSGLMQPHLAAGIEKATRKQFPDGIPAYGTDALRFTFASLATQSRDIRFDLARVAGYRNFCNKLWNAARFVLMAWENAGSPAPAASAAASAAASIGDRWIRSRLGTAITAVDSAFRDYRFDFAATAVYEFAWYELCDWYLEIAKPVLQSQDAAGAAATRDTLAQVLETLLRLLHPLMPFITEEIWQRIAPLAGIAGQSIVVAPWPNAANFPADATAEAEMSWVMQAVLGIRQIRGEMDIAPSRRVPLLLQHAGERDLALARQHHALLSHLAGLDSVRALGAGEAPPPAAAAVVGELSLLVPMQGLIEPSSELQRLERRVQKIEQELNRARGKLANDNFVHNAPPDVVVQERQRLADFERTRAGLARHIEQVRALAVT